MPSDAKKKRDQKKKEAAKARSGGNRKNVKDDAVSFLTILFSSTTN